MFVFTKPEPMAVELEQGEQQFTVFLRRPAFDELLDLYQAHGSAIKDVEEGGSRSLPVSLARAMCELFVSLAVDWKDVSSQDGKTLGFKPEWLRQIIDDSPGFYMQAVAAINRLMAENRVREKNVRTSPGSASSSENSLVK